MGKSTRSAGTEATHTTTSHATSRERITDSGPGSGGATSTAGTASSTGSTTTRPSTATKMITRWNTTLRPNTTRPPPKRIGSIDDSTLTFIHTYIGRRKPGLKIKYRNQIAPRRTK